MTEQPTCRIIPYVTLKSIKTGEKFFTTHTGDDPTKSSTGETWYEVIGFANTIAEAQKLLWPTKLDYQLDVTNYLSKQFSDMEALGMSMSREGKRLLLEIVLNGYKNATDLS